MRERIAIIGAGHVGLVYGACLAELGRQVSIYDIDRERIAALKRGDLPFFEPGLSDLVKRNAAAGNLTFSGVAGEVLDGAMMAFICVSTPSASGGELDERPMRSALQMIHRSTVAGRPIIVTKSTVSVGMNAYIKELFQDRKVPVVSNPEYLREGCAVQDFFHPHRIVLGSDDRDAMTAVARVYEGIDGPVFMTDPVTAELSKLASNAFLALKISFANSIARVAASNGGDPAETLRIVGADRRIGFDHLHAGLGFGGACLPKDLAAMEHLARRSAAPYELFAAVQAINRDQRRHVLDILLSRLVSLSGRRISVLGLAFKANTDDVRESPGLALISELCETGAAVAAHDPIVTLGPDRDERISQCDSVFEAAKGSDAVVIATDWPEYREIDLARLRHVMHGDLVVDGRAVLDRTAARDAGLDYVGIGS